MDSTLVEAGPEIFNFVGSDGKDLRTMVMEINQMYSEYAVQRNTQEPILKELERLRDDVETRGVARDTMAAVESFNLGALNERYPLNSYTQRRSKTNSAVAVEEIDARRAALLAALGVGAIAILYKLVDWIMKLFGKNKDLAGDVAKAGVQSDAKAKATEEIVKAAPAEVKEELKTAVKTNPRIEEALNRLNNEGSYNQLIEDIANNQKYPMAVSRLLDETPGFIKDIEEQLDFLDKISEFVANVVHGKARLDEISDTDEMIDDFFEQYSDLENRCGLVKEFVTAIGRNLGEDDYYEALLMARAAIQQRSETKPNHGNLGIDDYVELNRKVLNVLVNASGYTVFGVKPEIGKQLDTLSADLDRITRSITKLRRDMTPQTISLVSRLNSCVTVTRKYVQMLAQIIALPPIFLTKIKAFQNDVKTLITVQLAEVERASKKHNFRTDGMIQLATDEENRIIDKLRRQGAFSNQ